MPYTSREFTERKSLQRIEGYDYTQNGAYFVTICAKKRDELFGRIHDGMMCCSETGEVVLECIKQIEVIYPSVLLKASVVMPNHVHLLLLFLDHPNNPSLLEMIKQLKMAVSRKLKFSPWQERYHHRVIFTTSEFRAVQRYVETNAEKWQEDCYREERLSADS